MRALAHFMIVAATVLCAGCLPSLPIDSASNSAAAWSTLGSFAYTSKGHDSRTIAPTSCTPGDRQLFLGADFSDTQSGMVVRLAIDPLDGPAVRVSSAAKPFEDSVIFRRAECRTFHFSLDGTGWRINDVDDYKISLTLDCTGRNGDTLAGSAAVNHCH